MNKNLLKYIDELNDIEKDILYNDIKKIDFSMMKKLYNNSKKNKEFKLRDYSPCRHINKTKTDNIDNAIKLIKNREYSIVIMAGGNGSRLGFNGPKGCVTLNINNNIVSLYQIYINKLLDIYSKYNTYIKLYIMTSSINNKDTIKYFIDNNYLGYPKEYIKFFIQDDLPILDKDGNTVLKDKNHVLFGPNGNGNVFKALKDSKLLKDMKPSKYILFMGIDNPCINMVDMDLLELVIRNKYLLVSKSILKDNDNDMDGVFANYKNRPGILGKSNINKDINNMKIDNNYIYRDKNIIYHLISYKEVLKYSNKSLEYHRAYKKNSYIDDINPIEPNTFKFEQFIYDAFKYTKEMILYRVDNSEFKPIKNKDDLLLVEKYLSEANDGK